MLFMKTIMLAMLLMFSGCGPTVQYVGRNYTPTTNVDIFFSPNDIKREYEVMGKIDGKAYPFTDFEKIQAKIVEEAKKRGADAVIISGMGEEVINSSKNTTTTSSGEQKDQSWNSTSATVTTTNNQTLKVMRADFVKYK